MGKRLRKWVAFTLFALLTVRLAAQTPDWSEIQKHYKRATDASQGLQNDVALKEFREILRLAASVPRLFFGTFVRASQPSRAKIFVKLGALPGAVGSRGAQMPRNLIPEATVNRRAGKPQPQPPATRPRGW